MRLGVRPGGAGAPRVPALWVGVAEGDSPESLKLPGPLRAAMRAALASGDITGKKNQVSLVYLDSGRLVVSGLGPRKEVTPDGLRQAAATAARRLQGLKVK